MCLKPEYIVHIRSISNTKEVELVVASQSEVYDDDIVVKLAVAEELNNVKELGKTFCMELTDPPDQIKRRLV